MWEVIVLTPDLCLSVYFGIVCLRVFKIGVV